MELRKVVERQRQHAKILIDRSIETMASKLEDEARELRNIVKNSNYDFKPLDAIGRITNLITRMRLDDMSRLHGEHQLYEGILKNLSEEESN